MSVKWMEGMDSLGSEKGPAMGSRGHGNKLQCSTKGAQFTDQLITFLKEDLLHEVR
jgi:hypothetical protein